MIVWVFAGCGLVPKRLLISGKAVKGLVDSFGMAEVKGGEVENGRMEVKFELKGEKYSFIASRACYEENKPGDEVVVIYNPENPDDNRVYDPSHCWWVPFKE